MDYQIALFFIVLAGIILYLRQKNKKVYQQQKVTAKIDRTVVTATPNEIIYEALTVQPKTQSSLQLVGLGTEYYGNQIPIEHEIILGRDPSQSHLVFQSNEISRRHLRIKLEHPFVLIEDLGSSNGSEICIPNGKWQALAQVRYPLNQANGILIQMGSGKLKFRLEET